MSQTRLATSADAHDIARLLRAFNAEYDDIVPEQRELAERMSQLLAAGDTAVLLGYDPDDAHDPGAPHGLVVLRFRPAIWVAAPECYLAELYVAPGNRGRGLGRALLNAAIEYARGRGAAWMDLGTSEDDVAARALYESVGFVNREGEGGPIQYVYELDL
ncbi:GNAT family N-acetyltransferase [Compostimonas suwonensis]|uniref:Ribosomal protein S18 acetylase RimI-like enzyme n=1 Tax=Compostimonas suwonensis TaxID=1048394 RepID=A0A2M9C099_9MICO|nr:GNAT family N-acetyltransferase [Compostimonas suwonensis]PJJ63755.1 ribosomal protein S18 acetylase RimI-like enzyme [Compostimonas suwonensis]